MLSFQNLLLDEADEVEEAKEAEAEAEAENDGFPSFCALLGTGGGHGGHAAMRLPLLLPLS